MTTKETRHMGRHHCATMATLPITLLLAVILASCGGQSPAPAQNKRLTDQGPCDLAKVEDLEKIFGPVDQDPGPQQEGPQCHYTFEKGAPSIGRGADAARHGTSFEIDGVTAKKFEKNGTCAVDVWLVPDDLNQQFGVVSIGKLGDQGPCDVSITVARLILNNLPE